MHLPLSSQLLFTFTGVFLPLAAHLTDSGRTHLFNPKWMPHAKFHTAQTLAFAALLGGLTLWFAWRETGDYETNLVVTAIFASLYWITQSLAILYPNTKFFDPDTPGLYLLGIAAQVWLDVFMLMIVALACWLAMKALPAS